LAPCFSVGVSPQAGFVAGAEAIGLRDGLLEQTASLEQVAELAFLLVGRTLLGELGRRVPAAGWVGAVE
jgi:hypothetical protein